MAASYPGALKSYVNKTNKVDLTDAAHINSVQDEVVAIETELGTDVAGSATDLKTRLFVSTGNDGAIRQGTSFPADPIQGQLFWRTDESTMYIRAAAAWQASGGNLSNVIFEWYGCELYAGAQHGLNRNTTSLTTTTGVGYVYYQVTDTTYKTILVGKFKKIAGISTVTIQARIWADENNADYEAILNVDIGGQANTVKSITSITPSWVTSANINVSSLTNGTTYDITIQLKNETAGHFGFCSAVVLIAS